MQDDNQQDPLFVQGRATGVRNTVQLYVPTDLSEKRQWPLEQGDSYRGLVLPSGAILIWREGDAPDLPMTLEPPDAEAIPWPISSMGAPPPQWARLSPETFLGAEDAEQELQTEQTD